MRQDGRHDWTASRPHARVRYSLMPDRARLALDLPRPAHGGRSDAAPPPAELFGLPGLPIEPEWKAQSRAWPHAFHAICTYLGSLPPTLAHALIARWSRPGDVVLDPFSGRGSVPLQACLERRTGIGVDRNPLAALLTAAVVDPPDQREAHDPPGPPADRLDARIGGLDVRPPRRRRRQRTGGRRRGALPPRDAGPAAFPALAPRTGRPGRPIPAGRPGRASCTAGGTPTSPTRCPTPSAWRLPTPGAGSAERAVRPPQRDVFVRLDARLRRLYRDGRPVDARPRECWGTPGSVAIRLAAAARARGLPERVRLVVTSPPYLRVVRYGAANWLRLWLLGEDPARVDAALDAPASVGRVVDGCCARCWPTCDRCSRDGRHRGPGAG